MGATIKDVAKLAGTSTATVSKVMNGSYSISQETADKVRKAMEELDYHPNLRAKNFARQSARTIIFVAELGKGTGFANPQMFEILCGLEEVLAQKDYTLVVRNIAETGGRLCGIYPECSGYQAGRRVCDPCVSDLPGTG